MTDILGHMTDKIGDEAMPELFGRTRTGILMLLYLLPDSYPRQLSGLLGVSLSTVQSALVRLERDGVVASRIAGRSRRTTLNPRYFAARQLRELLARLVEAYPAFEERAARVRLRPRAPDKPL